MLSASIPVLTLDGPSGSGKGSVGQLCAQRLGWNYLDSGAVYRALACAVNEQLEDPYDPAEVARVAREMDFECVPAAPDVARILVNGRDVGDILRTEEVGTIASKLATIPEVRESLLALQRGLRKVPGLVADGRDMGTVVFPDANLKIFLIASAEERAKRRYNQLKLKGFDVSLADLFVAIQERDTRDTERSVSPLAASDDSVTIDSSGLGIDAVVARVLDLLIKRLGSGVSIETSKNPA